MLNASKHSARFYSSHRMFFAAAFSLLVTAISAQQPSVASQPVASATASANYGALPLAFEANRGQTDASVRFVTHGDGYSLFLTDAAAVLAMGKGSAEPEAIRMKLAGAMAGQSGERIASKAAGEDELSSKVNYFIGNDPAKWQTDLPTYAKVRYSSVYPGVDLVYYGNQRQLEYDFIVAPGASPAPIELEFAGAKQIHISAYGDLILTGAHGQAVFHKPVVYQEKENQRQPVTGSFRLLANNTVGFSLGSYDHARPLIIDPVLVYSTYLGGTGSNGHGDQGNGIDVDASGNAYVVGTTYSADFPVTSGAYQAGNPTADADNGASAVFISKLNATGTALIYSTYLGGSGGDEGYGIALDATNHPYVTGATYSADFPVTCGAIQTANNEAASGAPTGFVTKLNSAGDGLDYSTYLGGSGNHASPAQGDVAQAITVDASGDAYVTGYTYSTDFSTTDGAFQTAFSGSAQVSNVFVAKINPGGTALSYSTFLGGSGSNGAGDYGNAIAIDGAGDAFVAGSTQSINFPLTKGSYQATNNGSANGQPTAFVTELNPAGTGEVYSTYLGGSGGDSVRAIAVDSGGLVYVAGDTGSTDFPLTAGVFENVNNGIGPYIGFQPYNGPNQDEGYYPDLFLGSGAFVAKLNQSGSGLVYSTFLQGQATNVTGLAVDGSGNAYIAGSTPTAGAGLFGGFQQTPDALTMPTGGNSGFLVKLDPLATVLNYATMLGGSKDDSANALALDGQGNVYLTGSVFSADFPTTGGSLQTQNKAEAIAGNNAFISKFALASETNQITYPAVESNIGTSMADLDPGCCIAVSCYPDPYTPWDSWSMNVSVALYTNSFGPPPTGWASYNDGTGYSGGQQYDPVDSSWGEGASWGFDDGSDGDGPIGPFQINWTIAYSGDAIYAPSSVSGTLSISPGCSSPSDVRPIAALSPIKSTSLGSQSRLSLVKQNGSSRIIFKINPASSVPGNATSANLVRAKSHVVGPKYSPSPAASRRVSTAASTPTLSSAALPASASCSLPALTVTVVSASRLYGAANPSFTNTVDGLKNGDTVTVALSTAATPSSSAGYYPITATVSGAAASNYRVLVEDGTLEVRPAPLTLIAKDVSVTYGQTPAQPVEYFFNGFVNGDTASVVSGAPILTTDVTSTTPRGTYPIGVEVGTLSAANYKISAIGPQGGTGTVGVYKAPLIVTANTVTMTEGGTVPPLTYTISGFVNGEDVSVVSGAAVLSTTVTSSTRGGEYFIAVDVGSLSAENYYFVPAVHGGVVKVAP